MKLALKTTAILALAAAIPETAMADGKWYPYEAEEVTPAFSADGTVSPVSYTPWRSRRSPGTSASRFRI